MTIEIKVPDIGDFKDVPVIEIHVQPGQTVKGEDPLVTLESDKATMDIPAPQAGTVGELKIKVGDRVGEGAVILTLEPEGAAAIPPKDKVKEGAAPASGEPAGYGSSAGVYETIEVKVPDIGDFKDVPVIEVHVAEGGDGQGRGPAAVAGERQGDDGRARRRRPAPSPASRSRSATGSAKGPRS